MNDIPSWEDSTADTATIPQWEDSTDDTPTWDDSVALGESQSPIPETDKAVKETSHLITPEETRQAVSGIGEAHPALRNFGAAVEELVGSQIPKTPLQYAAQVFPPLAAFEQGKALASGDISSIPIAGRVPEIIQAEQTPAFSKERFVTAGRTLMDVGALAGAAAGRVRPRGPQPIEAQIGQSVFGKEEPVAPNITTGTGEGLPTAADLANPSHNWNKIKKPLGPNGEELPNREQVGPTTMPEDVEPWQMAFNDYANAENIDRRVAASIYRESINNAVITGKLSGEQAVEKLGGSTPSIEANIRLRKSDEAQWGHEPAPSYVDEITIGGEQYAKQISETAPVYGDVQQPGRAVEGAGEMPANVGGEGVPARRQGEVVGEPAQTPERIASSAWKLPNGEVVSTGPLHGEPPVPNAEVGFLTTKGRFLDRTQAGELATGLKQELRGEDFFQELDVVPSLAEHPIAKGEAPPPPGAGVATKEQVVAGHPELVYRPEELSPGTLASRGWRGTPGSSPKVTVVGDKFFDLPPVERQALLTHELGHDVAAKILADPAWTQLMEPLRIQDGSPLSVRSKYSNPVGVNPRPEEILSDIHEEITKRGMPKFDDPAEWSPETAAKLKPIYEAVAKEAQPPPPGAGAAPEVPPAERGYAGMEPLPQKPSKIGKSIEAKAVEAKMTKGFGETAGYDPVTIADQAQRAASFVKESPTDARAVVRGEATLPEGLRGTSLITAMEEQLMRKPDPQLAYELANSPLTSATSVAAQEMRLMRERVPDSISAAFQEIRAAREEGSKLRGETPKLVKEIKTEIVKNSSKRPTWEAFVREITC